MLPPSDHDLSEALKERTSAALHSALMETVVATEPERKTIIRRFSRKSIAVLFGLALSGTVIPAAALPSAIELLFPPAVTKSFTFKSGVTCTADIRVTSDYATSDDPAAAMEVAQAYLTTLDVSALPIEKAFKNQETENSAVARAQRAMRDARTEARAADPTLPAPAPEELVDPFEGESAAVVSVVIDAMWAELESKGVRGGVSLESSRASCE